MTTAAHYPLLLSIDSPADLRKLGSEQLPTLAQELRQYMVDCLDQCGGHFAANLGVVELTIALHYVFNTPTDKLVWDVGHQGYPHKVLTGRRDRLHTIKQPGGLAPFLKREESIYDTFGVGHSSTSISAALGMAVAAKLNQENYQSVAIIGDGGLTGGMAFEALNHAGSIDADLLVVLNDNDMSISDNVGALTNYLARILSGKIYSTLREGSKKVLDKMPPMRDWVKRTETHMKGMITPGTLFEELGFHYFGPIDGHSFDALVPILKNLYHLKGPRLLHVATTKGKGYAPAEADQIKYHAVSPGFHTGRNSGNSCSVKTARPSYSEIFGNWLCDMAESDQRLIGITPAMCEGSGMIEFAKRFPERYFDVAIAEQHAVTFAAGLACAGKKPVVAIYSTFLQRGYDQLIHDVALQNLDVTFALDRAGLVGADGPTHSGRFDLSYLRCLPNIVVLAPSDENECRQMLYTAYQYPGPSAVRYPRGSGPGVAIEQDMQELPIGKAEIRRQGQHVALLAFGSMLHPALAAGEKLNATVVNMRFVKPLDEALLMSLAPQVQLFVTLEENTVLGGAGSAVNEALARLNLHVPVLNLGLPDRFLDHGVCKEMLASCGLDAAGIEKSVQEKLAALAPVKKKSVKAANSL